MENIDKYIKECNLVFTDTNKYADFSNRYFDFDDAKVNYDDSISLFNLASSFNKLYLLFKKDYDKLEKLNFGKNIELICFKKDCYDNNDYRILSLYIDEPTITNHSSTILYLIEQNGQIKSFVTNDLHYLNKRYYREEFDIDKNLAKNYLDLFDKHNFFLETYEYLNNNQLFGDSCNSMFTVLDEYKSNLLNGLNSLKIFFGSGYFNVEYYVNLSFNLGDNFSLDYDNCNMNIDNKNIDLENDKYDKILDDVYINKKYVKSKKI